MNTYLKFLLVLFLLLIIYLVYKYIKKDLFKNKIKDLKEIVLLLTSISYIYILLSPYAKFIYDMTYIKAIVIMISLSCLYYAYGLIKNKEKTYSTNITYYIILYLILLTSITMFIGRININFDIDNLKDIRFCNLTPFRSIYRYLTYDVTLRKQIYNLLGNSIMLIPLSFLLMIKNKKYDKIINQTKVILPCILCIEVLQLLTSAGAFDIDDIILNYIGAIVFSFLITRFHIMDKIRKIFYKDFNLKRCIKYGLFFISMIVPILFIIDTIVITINSFIA